MPGLLWTPPFRTGLPLVSAVARMPILPGRPIDGAMLEQGRRLVRKGLGGPFWGAVPRALRPVVVQGAGPEGRTMLQGALSGHSAAEIVLLSPGAELAAKAQRAGCAVLAGTVDPWPLLAAARVVHAGSRDVLARLARLAYVPVLPEEGGLPHPAAELAEARYTDPFTGGPIDCAAAVDIVAEWRRVIDANRGVGALTGMSFWKRRRMGVFFHDGLRAPPHRDSAAGAIRAARGRSVATWSSRIPRGLVESGTPMLRVEDGFIRSAGLGSGFLPPGSVIADGRGIYYDPRQASDLEVLLQTTEFDSALLARARRLVARLVAEGVTKYGASGAPTALPDARGRRRVLVPGQVSDDLSVRFGGAGVGGNLDLLTRVRAANPDAYVIYKPHPDVDAGHREGSVSDDVARGQADLVLRGVPMAAVIGAVDEVHTLTSLAGFEALLRNRRVVTHGQPFYAGWGLTQDLAPVARRTRRLTLDELSAGVLLLYPRYVDPVTELPCPAEVLLDRLADPVAWPETPLMRVRRWQGQARTWFRR